MRIFKDIFVVGLAVLALIYLINPTAGILEFIPDNLPVLGNLDEAGATILLLNALAYYGLDVSRIIGSRNQMTITRDNDQPR